MESIEGALNESLEPSKTPESQMAAHQVRGCVRSFSHHSGCCALIREGKRQSSFCASEQDVCVKAEEGDAVLVCAQTVGSPLLCQRHSYDSSSLVSFSGVYCSFNSFGFLSVTHDHSRL